MRSAAQAISLQQQRDPTLSRRIGYKVTKVNQNAQSRVRNVLTNYNGPDQTTLSLLRDNNNLWLGSPQKFFSESRRPQLHSSGNPHAELMGLFLRAERDTA